MPPNTDEPTRHVLTHVHRRQSGRRRAGHERRQIHLAERMAGRGCFRQQAPFADRSFEFGGGWRRKVGIGRCPRGRCRSAEQDTRIEQAGKGTRQRQPVAQEPIRRLTEARLQQHFFQRQRRRKVVERGGEIDRGDRCRRRSPSRSATIVCRRTRDCVAGSRYGWRHRRWCRGHRPCLCRPAVAKRHREHHRRTDRFCKHAPRPGATISGYSMKRENRGKPCSCFNNAPLACAKPSGPPG